LKQLAYLIENVLGALIEPSEQLAYLIETARVFN
jgi:hypothetical protein